MGLAANDFKGETYMSCNSLRILTLFIVLSFLPLISVSGQTPQKELDDAVELSEQVDKLTRSARYDEAMPLAERALSFFERLAVENELDDKDSRVSAALLNLGRLLQVKEDYRRAEILYQRALKIREQALGQDHPDVARAINYIAGLHNERGDYAVAEQLVKRSLAIREKALGPEHVDVGQSLNNLSLLYRTMGNYPAAEQAIERAISIWEKALGPEDLRVSGALMNQALLLQERGDYFRAEQLFGRALAIKERKAGPEHRDVAVVLGNMSSLYLAMRDISRAESLARRALLIDEKVFGPTHLEVAQSLSTLAKVLSDKGDYTHSESLYQRALAIKEKLLGPDHAFVANINHFLGLLYRDTGQYDRAEFFLQHALIVREKEFGPNHPLVAESLTALARLYRRTGNYQRALALLQRREDIRERNLNLRLSAGSERQKQLYLDTLVDETNALVSFHLHEMPTNERAAQLALTAILRRKGRALDATIDEIGTLRRRSTPENRDLLSRLATARSALASFQFTPNEESAGGGSRLAEALRVEQEIEHMEGEVSKQSVEYRSTVVPVTLDRVRSAMPLDAALVELFVYRPLDVLATWTQPRFGPPRYVAYVQHPSESVPQFVELGEAASIDTLVEQLRAALHNPNRADYRILARALDERVMRPIRKLLGPTHRIFLAPDGALNLMTFGALLDERNHYLIEDYSIDYLTSGRDVLRLQISVESIGSTTVLANPSFDTQNNQNGETLADISKRDVQFGTVDFTKLRYSALPGTAAEAAALNQLFPDATVLTEAQATEEALKRMIRPRILHIATHGFFFADKSRGESITTDKQRNEAFKAETLVENPLLRSGLILAGVNQRSSGRSEDGVLTAFEVAGLDLFGTELVVLSACETGLGDARNGQGVYGLRRALVLAGSGTQVISLWKVSDRGTRDLMVAYYKRLQKGQSRTEALRQVQLDMLRGKLLPDSKADLPQKRRDTNEANATTRAKNYRHPYYWASFIASGDWRNMTNTSTRH